MLAGDPAHALDQLEALLLVEGQDVEARIAIVRITEIFARVLARKKARSKRAPDSQP
ncbi:hypothetical protein D9M68_393790 [compost metagenome]